MANTAQARKRARQATKQRAHNMSQRSTLRTAIKKVKAAIDIFFCNIFARVISDRQFGLAAVQCLQKRDQRRLFPSA